LAFATALAAAVGRGATTICLNVTVAGLRGSDALLVLNALVMSASLDTHRDELPVVLEMFDDLALQLGALGRLEEALSIFLRRTESSAVNSVR